MAQGPPIIPTFLEAPLKVGLNCGCSSLASQTLGEGRESGCAELKWPQVADKWVSGPDCARTATNAL